ncbi:MAG: hypothetical protein R3308_07510 [Thiohalobacterales bacterium]|nr:hypothetical protein [Thiohalobacterales bacterium]
MNDEPLAGQVAWRCDLDHTTISAREQAAVADTLELTEGTVSDDQSMVEQS